MGECRGTKALELWCRRMTEGYPGVQVNNMTTSWRDGLAFCAMIHHFRPDLIDFSTLNKDDVYKNNLMAFEIAEHHLGIPALLEPDDMVKFPVPDRLSIMTYLSQFYQTFVVAQGTPARIVPKRPAGSTDRASVSPTPSTSPSKMPKPVVGIARREPCYKCGLPVVIAERLHINNQLYHRTCFTCSRCNTQLTLSNYCESEVENTYCCETCPDTEPVPNRSLSDEEKSASIKKLQEHDDLYSDLFESAVENPTDNNLTKHYTLDLNESNLFVQARSRFMTSQLEDSDDDEVPDLPETVPPVITLNEPPDLLKFVKKSEEDFDLVDHLKDNNILVKDSALNDTSPLDIIVISSEFSDSDSNSQLKTADDSLENITKESVESSMDKDTVNISGTNNLSDIHDNEKCDDLNISSISQDSHDDPAVVQNEPSVIIISSSSDTSVEDDPEVDSEQLKNKIVEEIPPKDDAEAAYSEDKIIEESLPKDKIVNDDDYPEDLNPFGDDADEEVVPKMSLNPFDDDDDDEDNMPPMPTVRKKVSLGDITRIGPELYMQRISVTPSDTKLQQHVVQPVPLPRKDRTSLAVPSPTPRKPGLECSSLFGSNTSLSSTHSSIEPGRRKKKQAPKPPSTNLVNSPESAQSSLASTPCTSAQHSPKLVPKSRKLKKAPAPPSSTPFIIKSEPARVSISPIFFDSPKTNDGMDTCDVEHEKVIKDEVNRNRQSQSFIDMQISPNQPKLKRISKGPAPSRPVAEKRRVKSFPLIEIKHELDVIEIQMQGLEKQGARLEDLIRDKCEGPDAEPDSAITPEVDNLILELFEIVNERNALFRRQAELMYLRRQQRLEEEYADLEYQIRCLILVPEPNKTDSDKAREEELIKRLYEVVERRNEIVNCLEMDRIREAEEDDSINNQLTSYSTKSTKIEEESVTKKKSKKFKLKSISKKAADADKDIDESEASPKKDKKKKKFAIF